MAVFRFLINVNKCLDMSHYQSFFYKLRSNEGGAGCIHVNEAQLVEGDPHSLRKAVANVRMYLDKYPDDVDDYRIILLMRTPHTWDNQHWEKTLLYSLLRLRYEFRQARILLATALDAQRSNALNFVMLYDSDFGADLPTLTPYFSSDRITTDVHLLLKNYGCDPDSKDMDAAGAVLQATLDKASQETAEAYETDLLRHFISRLKQDAAFEEERTVGACLAVCVKEMLANYRVYERFVNCSDRREENLAFLRLVDFILDPTQQEEKMGGPAGVTTLIQRCDDAWNRVWSDLSLKSRYANMLAAYRSRLLEAQRKLELPQLSSKAKADIPDYDPPGVADIVSEEGFFAQKDAVNSESNGSLATIERYAQKKWFGRHFGEEWNATYTEIRGKLAKLKEALVEHAQELSSGYSEVLAKRKQDTQPWRTADYVAFSEERKRLNKVEAERESVLKALKMPNMTPTLSLQDILNSEQNLEKANNRISFYLDCIKQTTFINFLVFLAVCAGFFVLHYTVLQPYVFQSVYSTLYYLLYIAGAVALMLLSYGIPCRYYSKKVRDSFQQLQDELSNYIKNYIERAQYFSEYINYINQLDYMTRYRNMLLLALARGDRLYNGRNWHKKQVGKHLEMLGFFDGFINTATQVDTQTEVDIDSLVDQGRVRDVVDCSLYWPQA